jgi:2'-hydroxyisoflavone reductase
MTPTTRRDFLRFSIAAGAISTLPLGACATSEKKGAPEASEPKRLSILILGGTGFLGPAIVEVARARGHALTLFNRGRTNPQLFPDLEKLQGDRDPDQGEGIRALANRRWDVVFDDCGYYPRHVKASAELLAPNVAHYVYVSSISAYARNDFEDMDESAPVGTMADPTLETMGQNYEFYGPLKALCEAAAEAAFPGRCTNIRPGYIVGPGDPSDRFTYWPARFDKGGDVLVPGNRSDPVQVIDVRDLAAWMVHCAETRTFGLFNACGPRDRMAWGKVIDACVAAASQPSRPRWILTSQLAEYPDVQFPIWAPYEGETLGFHTVSNARAVRAGLKFRSIDATVRDTLAWFRSLPPERQAKLFERNLSSAREAEVIATLA